MIMFKMLRFSTPAVSTHRVIRVLKKGSIKSSGISLSRSTTSSTFLATLVLLSGCATSNSEVERALSLYKQCIDSGRSPAACEHYWQQRNNALAGAPRSHSSDQTNTLGSTFMMGIICSQTPNATACMTGAANTLTDKKSSTDMNEERLRRAEKRANDLEQTLRNQCVFKGGIYSPITGCNR